MPGTNFRRVVLAAYQRVAGLLTINERKELLGIEATALGAAPFRRLEAHDKLVT